MNNSHIINRRLQLQTMSTSLARSHTNYPITSLTVRRLHINLSNGFNRHWNGNNAFNTAFANALSMSFPVGEQFFIDAVKASLTYLPTTPDNEDVRDGVKKFIGQEATHRHMHGLYNEQLEQQGYRNAWATRIAKRIQTKRRDMERKGVKNIYLHELAITCAVEHLTAILGDVTLSRRGQEGDWFLNAVEPMKTLWHWHAAEESEHKSVAFDLYVRLGGNHKWRMYWFRLFLLTFVIDLTRQTSYNLWRDGTWKYPSTWASAVKFVLGQHGLLRSTWSQLRDYGRKDFHPQQQGDNQLAQDWLRHNHVHWSAVS